MRKVRTLGALCGALILAACAAAPSDGVTGSNGVYLQEIGPATMGAAERETTPILERHGFTINRVDRAQGRLSLETHWREREPFDDERARGVVNARTRALIQTRPRATTNTVGSNMSGVTLRLEVQHQMTPGAQWVWPTADSPGVQALVRTLRDAMKLELQVKGMEG